MPPLGLAHRARCPESTDCLFSACATGDSKPLGQMLRRLTLSRDLPALAGAFGGIMMQASHVPAWPSPHLQLRSHLNLRIVLAAILIAASTLFNIPASAQVESGVLAGTVTDETGAVIPNAGVTVMNLANNAKRTTQSSNTGAYTVVGLEPGTYQVSITSGQFKPYAAKIEVTVGSHVTLDAKLSINANVTEVQVVAEGGNTVNTQSQELSQVVDTQQLAQLPSLTRNPYDFVALSGNVSSGDNTTNSMNSGQNLTSRGVGFAINGQRQAGTEILLDGVENVSIFGLAVGEDVPVDSVQEYSVITNNFSAEYGRASGGVVNLTTKTGTNGYHGTAWEFNRLAAYTANTFANSAANAFAGSTVAPKGGYTRNQFGYFAGGPLLRDRLFFSQSTEWTRVRSNSSQTQEVFDPSFLAMLPANTQSYFASFGQGAVKPSGKVTTAGDLNSAGYTVGPINGVTPVAATTPVWDTVNFTAPFDAGGGLPQNAYALVGRLDYSMSDRTQMYFRGGRENIDEFTGSTFYSAYPQYDVGTSFLNQSYLYSLTHTFTPSVVLAGKASYTRFNENSTFDAKQTYVPNLMFLTPSDPVTGVFIAMPGLENSNAPGAGGLPVGGPQNTIQVEPDLSWVKGRHSMRFGGTWTYIQLNYAYGAYVQAVEQLGAGTQDSLDDLLNVSGNTGGSQLISFQARLDPQGKLPCHVNPGFWTSNSAADAIASPDCTVTPPLGTPSFARSYRYNDWDIYAQDSFKVTPKLTFNYGLRYEHYGVQHNNKTNLDSNFYFGSGSDIYQQVRNGGVFIANKSPVGQFWAPRWGTIAPRVGFALDLGGNGITSLRGGYGISYERNFGNVTYNASFNPPASQVLNSVCQPSTHDCSVLVTNSGLGPLGSPGPPALLPPAELRMPDPNINVASTQFWSLALQRQIVPRTIAEVSYSGAHGVHLYDLENVNLIGAGQVYLGDPLTFASSPGCASPCLNRPNNQYSNINMRGSMGSSAYNALNVRLQAMNVAKTGLDIIGNYTWSHALDDISSTFSDSLQGGSEFIGNLGYTNLLNPGLDWGSSDFDVRNRLSLSPIWATPWFKNQRNIEGQALGGWTLSGIYTIRSGIPFSVFDYNNDYNFYTVPRLTPATPITQYKVTSSPQNVGPNLYNALTVPVPSSFAPLNSTLGISDFGPYPVNMTRRNSFRGPGAYNFDLAVDKVFPLRGERMNLEFRAEGFDVFNHHNFYVNTTNLAYFGPTTTPMVVNELKGGLGSLATGGNHDERRFGQFGLKFNF
jgi:hypothetical protein